MTAPDPAGRPSTTAMDDSGDRGRIRDDFSANLFVEAGAGTGKTHELVERVVELLASGTLADVRGLAAITFTEKAAAELGDRIRRRLEQEVTSSTEGVPDPGRRARCTSALARLDEAAIGTLHGFALRILSELPIESGLPPAFELRDPVAASIDFDERWDRFVDELFDDQSVAPLLRRGFAMGLRLDHLRDVASELHKNWDRLVGVEPEGVEGGSLGEARHARLDPVDPGPAIEAIGAALECARSSEAGDKLAARTIEDLPPYLDQLRAAAARSDEPALLTLLVDDVPELKPRSLGARNGRIDQLRERLRDADVTIEATVAVLRRGVLLPLLDRLVSFTLHGAAERRQLGQLELADLLVHTVGLLENDADVRAELGHRWPVVLIDEFQDTDPLQIRIATLLTLTDPYDAPDRWESSVCEGGHLFVVGDPKQSIYRFRRADIALYERTKEIFADGHLQLTRNRRTVPPILDWVNSVFGDLLGEGVREKQPGYRPLSAERTSIDSESRPVLLLGGPREGSAAEIRGLEGQHVARAIADMVQRREPVSSRDGVVRETCFADVAILLPTRTALAEIERALARNQIPYRIEARTLLFGSDEVRELLTILQAVDHPGDAVALVGALRTPAFGCSDRDLAEYRWSAGQWSVRLPLPEAIDPDSPVPPAIAAIGRYHEMRQWIPVSELLARIIEERGLVEMTVARSRPRDHWRRYRLLVEEARAFVAGGGGSVGEFIAWAEQQSDQDATRIEAIVPEADDDAVRILTIHAAKGLEFPITIVAGLNAQLRQVTSRVLWPVDGEEHPEVRVGVKDARFETEGYREAAAQERGMDELERKRLLYVAATRARDRLVVSLYHKSKSSCHAAMLWDSAATSSERAELVDEPAGEISGGEGAAPPEDRQPEGSEALTAEIEAWMSERAALLEKAARPRVVSPSGLASTIEGTLERAPVGTGGTASGSRTEAREGAGGDGAAVGRAVHAALQVVDLAAPSDLEQVSEVKALNEGIPEAAGTVAELARSAIGSRAVQQAIGSRYWREVLVVAPLHPLLIEGYIDLLYETDDGELVVVDYKTDNVPDEGGLDAAVDRYRWQGAAYVLAVEEAIARPVNRCVFVFARAGGAVEREIEDLEGVKAELTARLVSGELAKAGLRSEGGLSQ